MDLRRLWKDRNVVLLDGAMGTQLDAKGLMGRGTANLEAPQAVLEVHRACAQAGCDALITNTLTMNRIYIETHNAGVSVRDVNESGICNRRRRGATIEENRHVVVFEES